ncbi:MAG: DUF2238 domain-containing protein [Deltaproteobacteria bacterium]|jgi:putative membrane protein|nr:DUF2238 domain-containing protein [Deltaproteobacteria bacterium]
MDDTTAPLTPGRFASAMLAVVAVGLVISGIGPRDRFTWLLEVAPVLIGAPIFLATFRRFPFTPLVYALLAVHAYVLMIGGHWTYAEVPFGFWLQKVLHFARNPYDRIGHFAQGFIPAIVGREILLRCSPLRGSRWLPVLVFTCCMTLSVTYEFIEWWTALATGIAAEAFLGTQGDPWDTQWDMFLCGVGAITALVTLSRLQDRQLARIEAAR